MELKCFDHFPTLQPTANPTLSPSARPTTPAPTPTSLADLGAVSSDRFSDSNKATVASAAEGGEGGVPVMVGVAVGGVIAAALAAYMYAVSTERTGGEEFATKPELSELTKVTIPNNASIGVDMEEAWAAGGMSYPNIRNSPSMDE